MPKFFKSIGNFFTGTPEKRENVSLLTPEQERLHGQLTDAAQRGKGGAFGQVADYYGNLLSDDSADYDAFAAPALRQFHQDIMPNISEQFAGMGSGGLSSSGFQNAQIQAGTDLAERLGALRANLRQSGAQGLQNLGSLGLNPVTQNMVTQPGTEGFLSQIAPAIGTATGAAFGGPFANSLTNLAGSWFGGKGNKVGANTSPYGSSPQASPRMSLPNFMQR